MIQQYEHFDHPADLGIIGHGETLELAIAGVMQGVFDAIVDTSQLTEERKVTVETENGQLEIDDLLVDLMSKVLLVFETEKFAGKFASVTTTRTDGNITGIQAEIRGQKIDNDEQTIDAHIKAATYHDLKVWQDPSGWHVKMLFDV